MSNTKTTWIVADLSPFANRIVATRLGANCEESVTEFTCSEGKKHCGYEVPGYHFVQDLKRVTRGEPGRSLIVYRQIGNGPIEMFDFDQFKGGSVKKGALQKTQRQLRKVTEH
jgi:hypothetical protein